MANQVAYGFMNLLDLFTRRVTTVGVDVVSAAIDQSVAEHNRQLNALIGLLALSTTQFKVRYNTPTVARLQPLDDNGRARPIKPAGYYDVAFPLQQGGAAWGQNYRTRAKMTVEEANDATNTLISADVRWMRDHIMAALFANAQWTFVDDLHGSLTIEGLANSDTVTYLVETGADAGETDTHYLAQAAAIDDSNDPYDDIYTELMEHPENGGDVVALIPTNLKATTKALTSFLPVSDPNIRLGVGQNELVGDLGVSIPGEIFGYHDAGVWLTEWKTLPSNYIVAVTTDGERPLAMREEPEAELQGFQQVARRDDHPFYESQWLRIAGFGAYNRVGAVVYRVGNASYAVPTGYSSPMA